MNLKSLIAVSVACVAAFGCSKSGLEMDSPAPQYKVILSGDLDTRTSLAPEEDGRRPVLWKTGDLLGLFVNEEGAPLSGAQNVLARLEAGAESGPGYSKGTFATSLSLTASKAYTLGIYYPYVSGAGSADAITHRIPSIQTQPAVSDSRHLGLSGHFSYATAAFNTPADLTDYTPVVSFRLSHKTSTILLSLTAGSAELAGWKVKSASVKAAGCALAGDVKYVPSTGEFTLTGGQSESVALNIPGGAALSVDTPAELYLVAFPTELAGKDIEITYTLEAADASAVKTLTHTRTVKTESNALGAGRIHVFEEVLPASAEEGWVYSAEGDAYDLSANGTANCYIVSAPGKYSFDATVIGNGQKGIMTPISTTFFHTEDATIAPVSASLVWQQTKGLITSVALDNGRVVFTKSADVEYGNALIAVKDAEGTILWSWHIWCTDMGPTHTYVSAYGTYEGMDRNLGATYASSKMVSDKALLARCQGMYYQFGRKDPFIGFQKHTKNNTSPGAWAKMYDIDGNEVPHIVLDNVNKPAESFVTYAIKNPVTFINYSTKENGGSGISDWFADKGVGTGPTKRGYSFWGNPEGYNYKTATKPMPVKTIYDPCPPGYMVPVTDFYTATKRVDGTGYVGIVQLTGGGYNSFYVANYAISSTTADATSIGYGYLWSSSYTDKNVANVSHFRFANSAHTPTNPLQPAYGFGVRCMQELR